MRNQSIKSQKKRNSPVVYSRNAFFWTINGKKAHTLNGSADPSPRPERTNAHWAQACEWPRASQWAHYKYWVIKIQLLWMKTYCAGNRAPIPVGSQSLFKWEFLGGNTAVHQISTQQKPHKPLTIINIQRKNYVKLRRVSLQSYPQSLDLFSSFSALIP